MITVSIWHHKDGNHLAVYSIPWWADLVETIIGRYQPRWGWDYGLWSKLLGWTGSQEQRLYQIELTEHPCLVGQKIWGDQDDVCWYDDCPVHVNEP